MKIVFDIGGTNMRIARAEGSGLGSVEKVATPADPEEALEALASLVTGAAKGESIEAIAGGIPAVVKDGVIAASPHLEAWEGVPFQARLEEQLTIPIHMKNDAALAGLGEARFGAGKNANTIAYLGVGTGFGSARIVGGEIDAHTFGFEAGHQIIAFAEHATLESQVSGSALSRQHGAEPSALSRAAYEAATPALAVGVWNAVMHWVPDRVVLGGSLMNEENGYRLADLAREIEAVHEAAYPRYPLPPVVRAELGDENGLYGALALLD